MKRLDGSNNPYRHGRGDHENKNGRAGGSSSSSSTTTTTNPRLPRATVGEPLQIQVPSALTTQQEAAESGQRYFLRDRTVKRKREGEGEQEAQAQGNQDADVDMESSSHESDSEYVDERETKATGKKRKAAVARSEKAERHEAPARPDRKVTAAPARLPVVSDVDCTVTLDKLVRRHLLATSGSSSSSSSSSPPLDLQLAAEMLGWFKNGDGKASTGRMRTGLRSLLPQFKHLSERDCERVIGAFGAAVKEGFRGTSLDKAMASVASTLVVSRGSLGDAATLVTRALAESLGDGFRMGVTGDGVLTASCVPARLFATKSYESACTPLWIGLLQDLHQLGDEDSLQLLMRLAPVKHLMDFFNAYAQSCGGRAMGDEALEALVRNIFDASGPLSADPERQALAMQGVCQGLALGGWNASHRALLERLWLEAPDTAQLKTRTQGMFLSLCLARPGDAAFGELLTQGLSQCGADAARASALIVACFAAVMAGPYPSTADPRVFMVVQLMPLLCAHLNRIGWEQGGQLMTDLALRDGFLGWGSGARTHSAPFVSGLLQGMEDHGVLADWERARPLIEIALGSVEEATVALTFKATDGATPYFRTAGLFDAVVARNVPAARRLAGCAAAQLGRHAIDRDARHPLFDAIVQHRASVSAHTLSETVEGFVQGIPNRANAQGMRAWTVAAAYASAMCLSEPQCRAIAKALANALGGPSASDAAASAAARALADAMRKASSPPADMVVDTPSPAGDLREAFLGAFLTALGGPDMRPGLAWSVVRELADGLRGSQVQPDVMEAAFKTLDAERSASLRPGLARAWDRPRVGASDSDAASGALPRREGKSEVAGAFDMPPTTGAWFSGSGATSSRAGAAVAPPRQAGASPGMDEASFTARIDRLHLEIDLLAPLAQELPPLPDISAVQRSAAGWWLKLGQESERLDASELPEAARTALRARLAAALAKLQPYMGAHAQGPASDETRVELLTEFQTRYAHGLDGADWKRDAVVLGWRMAVAGLPEAARALLIDARIKRLLSFGERGDLLAGTDFVLAGLVAAIVRAPNQLSPDTARAQHTATEALRRVFSRSPPVPDGYGHAAALERVTQALGCVARTLAGAVGDLMPLNAGMRVLCEEGLPDTDPRMSVDPQRRARWVGPLADSVDLLGNPRCVTSLMSALMGWTAHPLAIGAAAEALRTRLEVDAAGFPGRLTQAIAYLAQQEHRLQQTPAHAANMTRAGVRVPLGLQVATNLCPPASRVDAFLKSVRQLPMAQLMALLTDQAAKNPQRASEGEWTRLLQQMPPALARLDARGVEAAFPGEPLDLYETQSIVIALSLAMADRLAGGSRDAFARGYVNGPATTQALPGPDLAFSKACIEAIQGAVYPWKIMNFGHLNQVERLRLLERTYAARQGLGAKVDWGQLIRAPLRSELKLAAASRLARSVVGTLPADHLREMRLQLTEAVIDVDLTPALPERRPPRAQGQAALTGSSSSSVTTTTHSDADSKASLPAADTYMSEQALRLFEAAEQVGAVYSCIRHNGAIARFYIDTARVPLTPAAAVADQRVLRNWIDFLDQELLEISRPHVPAVLQHRLWVVIGELREPLARKYQVVCDMTQGVPAVPMEVEVQGLDAS